MNSLSTETLIQLFVWLGVLAGLLVLSVVVVQRFRGGAAGEGQSSSELLTKFQEMEHEGDISETEYRTIKSVLGARLQRDVTGGKDKP